MKHDEIKTSVLSEMKRVFNPEFINRVDEVVVFHSLNKDHLRLVFDNLISEVEQRLAEKHMTITVRKKAKEHLIDRGFDEKYGARPLRRIIQKEIEDPLSLEILKGRFADGSSIVVDLGREEKIVFRAGRSDKSVAPQELEPVAG